MYQQIITQSEMSEIGGLPMSDSPQIEEDEEDSENGSQESLNPNEQPGNLSPDRDGINRSIYGKFPIILLDLETSSFNRNCDILQIAAKCGTENFEIYINPTQKIAERSSEVHGLTSFGGILMYNGKQVQSVPLRIALQNFHSWLTSFGEKCYIATHNLGFDGPRLCNAINSCSLRNDFHRVVYGFIDTLNVIRKQTGRRSRGECTIKGLAEWLDVPTDGAHNAVHDVEILEQILERAGITYELLIDGKKTYAEQFDKWNNDKYVKEMLPTLDPLKRVVGETIRKRLVMAKITIEWLQEIYRVAGRSGITCLLEEELGDKPVITKHKSSIMKIIKWIEMNKK